MNEKVVSDVAYSLLTRAERDRLQIGTTKLIKLFYLIDCDHFVWNRQTLTQARWIFYHYGPYASELIDVINRTNGIAVSDLDDLEDGRSFRKYSISSFQKDPLDSAIWIAHPEIRATVNRIYREWAPVELDLILDHVYFATAPMLTAQRGEPLDFSLIASPTERIAKPVDDFLTLIPRETRQAVITQIRRRRSARTRHHAAWQLNLEEGDLEDLKRLEDEDDVSF
jgi:hypothetical protein